jgi:hypothetical protein
MYVCHLENKNNDCLRIRDILKKLYKTLVLKVENTLNKLKKKMFTSHKEGFSKKSFFLFTINMKRIGYGGKTA